MHMDKITESITHFIGLFHLSLEQARARLDYTEFDPAARQAQEAAEIVQAPVAFRPDYSFNDPDPGLRHVPSTPEIVRLQAESYVEFDPIVVTVPAGQLVKPIGGVMGHASQYGVGSKPEMKPVDIEAPGQVSLSIAQHNVLYDDDYVSVGGHGFSMAQIGAPAIVLDTLVATALKADPLDTLEQPGSPGAIGGFVEHAVAQLRDAVSEVSHPSTSVGTSQGDTAEHLSYEGFAKHAEAIEGIYIGGEEAAAAPRLEHALPEPLTKEGKAAAANEPKSDGTVVSVTAKAGANHLTNEVALESKGLAGGVFATLGKHVEVNAIVQTNVWSDIDSIGAKLSNWSNDAADTTHAFNIAEFEQLDTAGLARTDPGYSGFPQAWGLTKCDGDLTFTNWIEQVNFVSDNDVHVLSSSGVKTVLTTGGNHAVNLTGITEFGLYYDLVLAGGSIYDANLITQTNVLLDDDLIGAVGDFETKGAAKASTSGNLLWNQAKIVNAGNADRFDSLPEHYREAFDELGSGGKHLPDAVFTDGAFAGLAGLRVLYVTGSIYNLQVIKQMNVLGDADQVALARDKHLAKHDADWTITTGSNALVNVAEILDLDAMNKTYVGNGHFSDDFLIQAEIIKVDPLPGGHNADALISEAVAFLADGMVGCDDDGSDPVAPVIGMHSAHTDIMQSVTS